jgi:hypothetical protein
MVRWNRACTACRRSWKRYAAGRAGGRSRRSEKLIESAKALLVGENEIEALAKSITQLRDEWKRLNTQAARTQVAVGSFRCRALEQAYQPRCRLPRRTGDERKPKRAAWREEMCDIWEAELAGIDWSQADFKGSGSAAGGNHQAMAGSAASWISR